MDGPVEPLSPLDLAERAISAAKREAEQLKSYRVSALLRRNSAQEELDRVDRALARIGELDKPVPGEIERLRARVVELESKQFQYGLNTNLQGQGIQGR